MEFEWNEAKAESNKEKHGVSFEEAKTVFNDKLFVDFHDPDHSNDEHRYIILGESVRCRLLMVSYTQRGNAVRLISARKATQRERKAYEEESL